LRHFAQVKCVQDNAPETIHRLFDDAADFWVAKSLGKSKKNQAGVDGDYSSAFQGVR
jgi:hypothetical protein